MPPVPVRQRAETFRGQYQTIRPRIVQKESETTAHTAEFTLYEESVELGAV